MADDVRAALVKAADDYVRLCNGEGQGYMSVGEIDIAARFRTLERAVAAALAASPAAAQAQGAQPEWTCDICGKSHDVNMIHSAPAPADPPAAVSADPHAELVRRLRDEAAGYREWVPATGREAAAALEAQRGEREAALRAIAGAEALAQQSDRFMKEWRETAFATKADARAARADCTSAGKATDIYRERLHSEQITSDNLRKDLAAARDLAEQSQNDARGAFRLSEQLRVDAERWRWFKANKGMPDDMAHGIMDCSIDPETCDYDAIIDAARAALPKDANG